LRPAVGDHTQGTMGLTVATAAEVEEPGGKGLSPAIPNGQDRA
jgi:hypothetical protein